MKSQRIPLPPTLLVVDLEATCDRDGGIVPRHEMETIEIGAVLLDTIDDVVLGELQTFVRPVVHPILTPFCRQLTTITQSAVDHAPTFPEALGLLREFVIHHGGPGRIVFSSWGDYDKHQLERDALRHRVTLPLGRHHLNLKRRFSSHLGIPKKLGMSQALARVGLPATGTHHRAIDDARNIARLVPFMR